VRYQINVSRPVLARNIRTGSNDRPIIVRDYESENKKDPYTMAREVVIHGASKICNPSGHGVVIRTEGPIEIIDPKQGIDQ
jgi:hypothetical protein